MDSSTESGMFLNQTNCGIIQQDPRVCVNFADPTTKIVCTNDGVKSLETAHNYNYINSVDQPSTTIVSQENKNDGDFEIVIDLSQKNPVSQEVQNSTTAQLCVSNQNDAELENNDDVILIEDEVDNSITKNKINTDEASVKHSVVLESNLEKTTVAGVENSQNHGLETQIKVQATIDHQYTVCNGCYRLRMCKYIPSMGTYACIAICYKTNSVPEKMSSTWMEEQNNERRLDKMVPTRQRKKCAFCSFHNITNTKSLAWETMDFCSVECLSRYQILNGSFCSSCHCFVKMPNMGKYAVRIALEIRQFCSALCLDNFKKNLKLCCYCQVDMTNNNSVVSIPVDVKEKTMEFCSNSCVEKYKLVCTGSVIPPLDLHDFCAVCANKRMVEIQVILNSDLISLCSYVCFRTFRFANNIIEISKCMVCKKFFPPNQPNSSLVYYDGTLHNFCNKICLNSFILIKRKIVSCNWCRVKKYNFDMIKNTLSISGSDKYVTVCSLNCLTHYQVSMNASSKRKMKCDLCYNLAFAQFNLIMSDTSTRYFCSYECISIFRARFRQIQSSLLNNKMSNSVPVPLVSSATLNPSGTVTNNLPSSSILLKIALDESSSLKTNLPSKISALEEERIQNPTKYIQQIILKPPEPKECSNKFAQCKPSANDKECQTEFLKYALVPIPIPLFVPFPVHMYSTPIPMPVPITLPCPVPVLIPILKKTYQNIMSEMKKTSADTCEGDLMMAKNIKGENELGNISDSDDVLNTYRDVGASIEFSCQDGGEKIPQTKNFISEKAPDGIMHTAQEIENKSPNNNPTFNLISKPDSNVIGHYTQRKESGRPSKFLDSSTPAERSFLKKRTPVLTADLSSNPKRTRPSYLTYEKPENNPSSFKIPPSNDDDSSSLLEDKQADADYPVSLKVRECLTAWKQWLTAKNKQIKKSACLKNKKAKLFNTNILKLTVGELNYLLCKFIKEIRQPNGAEYTADGIYYLCLCIQQYLFQNGCINNIFVDKLYEPFIDVLDEVARKFSSIKNTSPYTLNIRVEEELLWECEQLGGHSPYILLATLLFFNTKFFNLLTLEEHMQLSFSNIRTEKLKKRSSDLSTNQSQLYSSNLYSNLRFYPPQTEFGVLRSRIETFYEVHENEENTLRCPVRLFEFYLSKCPEIVKQRTDIFYLQPEDSCLPDSPTWFSTTPLQKDKIVKMLNRFRMVKEIITMNI